MIRNLHATLLILLVFACCTMQAQVSLVIDQTHIPVHNLQDETISHSTIVNQSDTDTLYLAWDKSILGPDLGWEISICDKNKCYDNAVTSNVDNSAIILLPGESSLLDIRVNPKNNPGKTNINLDLVDLQRDVVIDSELFTFDGTKLATSKGIDADIKIFPNPTSDIFYLKNDKDIRKISIFSIVGKEIKSFSHMAGASYGLNFLSKGIYIVRLFDEKNKAIKVLRLQKK